MEEHALKYLRKFYRKLRDNLELKNKSKHSSILSAFFDIKSNARYTFLIKSSIESNKIPKNIFGTLLSKDYVMSIDKLDYYTITAKGIWEIETRELNLNCEYLIKIFDEKLFKLFKPLASITDKEKIILLFMITIRAFSEMTVLDLKVGDHILSQMEELLKDSYDLLNKYGYIKYLKKENIFGAKGHEHPVSNLIRHTDGLHKKTKGIYTAIGKQKYYLNLFKDNLILKDDLSFLIRLIFGNKITIEVEDALEEFCLKNTYSKGIYLYNSDNLIFINPQYDGVINEAVFEIIINKN